MKLIGFYTYREVIVCDGISFPRENEFIRSLEYLIPPRIRDNYTVGVFETEEDSWGHTTIFACWFNDFNGIIGKFSDICASDKEPTQELWEKAQKRINNE